MAKEVSAHNGLFQGRVSQNRRKILSSFWLANISGFSTAIFLMLPLKTEIKFCEYFKTIDKLKI